jgi:hypothetical protein
MRPATIYALVDPRRSGKDAVRYIGVTHGSLRRRLTVHLADARCHKDGPNHRVHWLMSLLSAGVTPQIVALETVDRDGFKRECQVIAEYRSEGYDLTNTTDGGEGTLGYVVSPDVKARNSDTARRSWADPKYGNNLLDTYRQGDR